MGPGCWMKPGKVAPSFQSALSSDQCQPYAKLLVPTVGTRRGSQSRSEVSTQPSQQRSEALREDTGRGISAPWTPQGHRVKLAVGGREESLPTAQGHPPLPQGLRPPGPEPQGSGFCCLSVIGSKWTDTYGNIQEIKKACCYFI